VLAALRRRGRRDGRMLDFGAYFGNFSLMCARAGFQVDALDAFANYAPAFDGTSELLRSANVRVLDFADIGRELEGLEAGHYDVVLCMGVIEHIPHTPRLLLEGLNRILKPGGTLAIDTPNVSQLYNRQRFSRGESVQPDLPTQFHSNPPFEGHHREYTIPELIWMLNQIGHHHVEFESFNYSLYALGTLRGRDVINHWAMVQDPALREIILTLSTQPQPADAPPIVSRVQDLDWRQRFTDPERTWRDAVPPQFTVAASPEGAHELMIEQLQNELVKRDGEVVKRDGELIKRDDLLRRTHDHLQSEITRRDDLLRVEVERRDQLLLDLQARLDATIDARIRRVVRAAMRAFGISGRTSAT